MQLNDNNYKKVLKVFFFIYIIRSKFVCFNHHKVKGLLGTLRKSLSWDYWRLCYLFVFIIGWFPSLFFFVLHFPRLFIPQHDSRRFFFSFVFCFLPKFQLMQELAVSSRFAPKDSADKKAADLFISFAARDTEIEKTYLLSTRLSLRTQLWSTAVSLGYVLKFFFIKLFFLSVVSIIRQEDKLTRGLSIPLPCNPLIEPDA